MKNAQWFLVLILVSLYPVYAAISLARDVRTLAFIDLEGGDDLTSVRVAEMKNIVEPLRDSRLLLGLAGRLRRAFPAEAVTAYREAIALAPDNPAARTGLVMLRLEQWQAMDTTALSSDLVEALREARQAEPANAFHDYLEGTLLVQSGLVQAEEDTGASRILNRSEVMRGLALIRSGNAKTVCTSHDSEQRRAVVALEEKLHGALDPIGRLGATGALSFPHVTAFNRLRLALPAITSGLPGEDRRVAAEALAGAGKRLAGGAHSILELLITDALTNQSVKTLIETSDEPVADAWRAEAARHETLIAGVKNSPLGFALNSLSTFDAAMMPSSGWRDYDPGPSRRLEYALLERVFVGLLALVFSVLGFGALAVRMILSARGAHSEATPAISWTARELLSIVAGGILAPVFGFLFFDRVHYSRDFGLAWTFEAVGTQFTALVLFSVSLTLAMISRRLARKWSPENLMDAPRFGFVPALGLSVFIAFFWMALNGGGNGFCWLTMVLALIVGGVATLRVRWNRKRAGTEASPAARRLAMATTIAAVALVAVLCLSLVQVTLVIPYFDRNLEAFDSEILSPLIEDEVAATNWIELRDYHATSR